MRPILLLKSVAVSEFELKLFLAINHKVLQTDYNKLLVILKYLNILYGIKSTVNLNGTKIYMKYVNNQNIEITEINNTDRILIIYLYSKKYFYNFNKYDSLIIFIFSNIKRLNYN